MFSPLQKQWFTIKNLINTAAPQLNELTSIPPPPNTLFSWIACYGELYGIKDVFWHFIISLKQSNSHLQLKILTKNKYNNKISYFFLLNWQEYCWLIIIIGDNSTTLPAISRAIYLIINISGNISCHIFSNIADSAIVSPILLYIAIILLILSVILNQVQHPAEYWILFCVLYRLVGSL